MTTEIEMNPVAPNAASGQLRVLIVEDSPEDAELVVRQLRRSGYDPSWRRVDSAGALASALAGETWDIVLSDYSMPCLSGLDALAVVKAGAPDLPFILISGAVGEEVAVEVMRAGACDYVLKDRLGRLGPAVARELREALGRRARRAAERQVHILTWVIEQSPTVVVVTDVDGQIRYVNPRFTALTGYGLAEVLRKTPAFLKSGHTSQAAYDELWRTIKAGREWRGEFCNRRRDGSLYWESAAVCPLRDSSGRIAYFVKIAEDISEQRRAQELLRESEERLRLIVDSAQDAVIMMDAEGAVSLWNAAAERIFGYSAAEVMGRPLHGILAPLRHREAFERVFPRSCESGQGAAVGRVVELVALRRDGTELPVELSVASVCIRGGWHAVGILRDITLRRRADEALRRSKDELEQANAQLQLAIRAAQSASRAKSEFLANISHEIRTPMNGVIGMTGLLLNTPLTIEQRQYAEIVRSSGEALLRLVNDLLDFSKIEAKRLDLELLDFDLRSTVEESVEMLAVKAQEKGLELTCLIPPDLPSRLRGDPGRLRQILTNLVGNAIKFTASGDVSIEVRCTTDSEESATLYFEIRDTGVGIPADRLDGLFESFSQVDGSTTRRYGGTGLGLAISRELVQMMGGQIGVESEPGKGSCFWFTAVFGKQPRSDSPPDAVPVRFDGVRALVVDDHGPNRLLVCTLLRSWGCRTSEATDGPGALAALRDAVHQGDPYRVAFLDMHMPGMDGETVAAEAKADPATRDTLLIMLSSLGERSDAERLAGIGFADCLSKPLRALQLHGALAVALGLRPAPPRSAPVGTGAVDVPPRLDRSRFLILLAEDNPTNQLVALGLLKKLGYRADAVANGTEVLAALRTIRYDLVLMDCQMPEMDGFTAASAVRKPDSGVLDPRVPIIALTAHAMQGDRARCIQAGMDDYLPKPIQAEELARMLDGWLCRGDAGGAAAGPSVAAPPPARSETAAPTVAVFNAADLLHRLMSDRGLARSFVDVFVSDAPAQVAAMKRSLATGRSDDLRQQAHGMKGAAASVSAESVRDAASAIEKLAAANDVGEVPGLLSRLEQEIDRFGAVLRAEGWIDS